jgi:hypothetical protein
MKRKKPINTALGIKAVESRESIKMKVVELSNLRIRIAGVSKP